MLPARVVLVAAWIVVVVGACAGRTAPAGEFVEIPGVGETRADVPRPSTRPGADCEPALPDGEPVNARAAALRGIGFFADRSHLSDDELGAEIETTIRQEWGIDVDPSDPFLELLVAGQDEQRIWWRDLEADVGPGGDVYVSTIREWAAISVGAFAPESIEEDWASAEGPITVTVTAHGKLLVLEPEYLEDWIDPRIATPINELIAPSGRQFTFFQAFDQTAFVVALTDSERVALEDRGWCFE